MFCSILLFFATGPNLIEWQTQGTEIYRPLVSREVAVNQDGRLFMVNRDEARILVFEPGGAKLTSFGGKGDGPGELQIPTWLYLDQKRLYVEDAKSHQISVFDHQGQFIKRVRLPFRNLVLAKVRNGWVFGDWETTSDQSKPVRLYWADASFKGLSELATWPRPQENASPDVQGTPQGKVPVAINPASDVAHLVGNRAGDRVFLIKHQSGDIEVFDVANKQMIKRIESQREAVPFNDEWGDQYIKTFSENLPEKTASLVKILPNFPSHFPIVRRMRMLNDDTLLVSFWTGLPDRRRKIQCMNRSLSVLEPPFEAVALERVIFRDKGLVYLTLFDDEEEEGRIAAVRSDRVAAFIKAHPIEYDGVSGNDVVVE